MTTFQLIHGLGIGDIDRATLNAMFFLQGEWGPSDEIKALSDEALAVSIICECSDEAELSKLYDAACEINHEDRFCE